MKLDELSLPPKGGRWHKRLTGETPALLNAWGLACARAGALAALDEAMKQIDDDQIDRPNNDEEEAYNEAHVGAVILIRRLRDTIVEGK